LAEYAGERAINLGLENRYHYFEIPSPDELGDLLELGFANVGFWYDVGHAETWDQLGFVPHEEWLRRFSSRIIGVHLHDVVGIDDHRAAGAGNVNWDMVARYLPAGAMRTCEFQNNNSPEQIAAGVQWLVEKGCVKP
jgi:sugar phosphate isomerase/epimerase